VTTLSPEEVLKRHRIAFVATKKETYTTNCPECSGGYLNVKIERDGVAWYCHHCKRGGRDKFEQSKAHSELGPIKACYDYTDEHGRLLFQVLRFEPVRGTKQFRQRTSPDQKKWSIKGVRLVPFRLPCVVAAITQGRAVFIVEGEKDVLTLECAGIVATCNPMGAEKWCSEFNSIFQDADVVIVGDNDEPGRRHVRKVARELHGIARSIRLIDIKAIWRQADVGDDVTDWFEAGGSRNQLLSAAEAAPRWTGTNGKPPPWVESEDKEHEPADANEDTEIQRLAKLSLVEYDRQREMTAKRLGIRTSTLDLAVRQRRAEDNPSESKQGRALMLPEPEPWPEPIEGAAVLTDIAAAVRSYVVMTDAQADAVALWAVHTHCYEIFDITPRLAITSPTPQCGKTTLLDTIACLVMRPLPTANVTCAAIFRAVEIARPTLLIDEADTFAEEKNDLRGVLNSGHRKGGSVTRTVGDDHEPRQFATFAPATMAAIGKLPDTLQNRSIAIELKRRTAAETIERFRLGRTPRLDLLARRCARWAADHRDALAGCDPDMGDLFNRVADNWRPLFSIADLAGGEWPMRARAAARAIDVDRGDDSVKMMVLADIKTIFALRGAIDMRSKDLAEALAAMEGRPWAEYGKQSKPITANALARLLKQFKMADGRQIVPGDIWIEGKSASGYSLAQFEDAFRRYLEPEVDSNSETPRVPINQRHAVDSNSEDSDPASELKNLKSADATGVLGVSELGSEEGAGNVQRLCDHCGNPSRDTDPLRPWDYPSQQGLAIWLHGRCEEPWMDSQRLEG
jgi:putative DNA primase/helicase